MGMRIVSMGYDKTGEFTDPVHWLDRIRFYTGILEALAQEHEVFSIERISFQGEMKQGGVQYIFFQQSRSRELFPVRMHRLVKKLKPDVVLVNGFQFPWQILQLRWTLGNRVKIIILHRAERPAKGLKKFFQRRAADHVHAFFFSAASLAREWTRKGIIRNRQKIREIMQASSMFSYEEKSIARARLGIDGSPVFLWVGRLETNKDPLTVVRGFRSYLAEKPSARLYMIFQSDELLTELKRMTEADPCLEKAIHFVGKLPHHELGDWYNSADYFLSGSHYEGSGIALCEAMSCGCIPVVTNIDSFRRLTANGNLGFLYEAGNDHDLLRVLRKSERIDLDRESELVRVFFEKELSFEAIAKKFNEVISGSSEKPI